MAKKPVKEREIVSAPEPKRRGLLWLWISLSVFSFLLLVAVLHLAGALRAPEEAIYSATKNVPVVGFFTRPLHKEDWKQALTPEQMIDVKDLRNNLIRLEGQVSSMKKAVAELSVVSADVSSITTALDNINKELKTLKQEGGYVTAETTGAAGTPGAPAPAAMTQLGAPSGATVPPMAATGENYRLVSKIFEKLPADTAVDILNNLSDEEKVKILTQMKEKTVADILSAFDPIKSAELTRMIAKSRGT